MTNTLTDDQINQCRQVFSFLDTNGDGEISAAELGNVLKALDQNPTKTE